MYEMLLIFDHLLSTSLQNGIHFASGTWNVYAHIQASNKRDSPYFKPSFHSSASSCKVVNYCKFISLFVLKYSKRNSIRWPNFHWLNTSSHATCGNLKGLPIRLHSHLVLYFFHFFNQIRKHTHDSNYKNKSGSKLDTIFPLFVPFLY